MTEEAAQHSPASRDLRRAPDGWESPRFQALFLPQVGSIKMAWSRPAHPRVTHTVGRVITMVKPKEFGKRE